MSEQTGISWTDSTFNPWMGCTKVSPACDHCYAERDTKRFGRVEWGAGKPRVRTTTTNWKQPERWNAQRFGECSTCGWRGELLHTNGYGEWHCRNCTGGKCSLSRRRVFCASLADWLDNEVPIEWLVDLLDLIRRTPNLDWLLLTKRIGNWRSRLTAALVKVQSPDARPNGVLPALNMELMFWLETWIHDEKPPLNVWIGSTVINQDEADRDVPKLLRVPAAVRFLSIEPMLGPIKLADIEMPESGHGYHEFSPIITGNPLKRADYKAAHVHWVIAGGESGPHARPMHPDWVRSLRDQAQAAGVAFHFKQWGEWAPNYLTNHGERIESSMWMDRMGKKAAGRTLDGREWNGFPWSAAR